MDAFIFFFRFSASQNERKKKDKRKTRPLLFKKIYQKSGKLIVKYIFSTYSMMYELYSEFNYIILFIRNQKIEIYWGSVEKPNPHFHFDST